LDIDLGELSNFFTTYVDFDGQKVNLNMAAGMSGSSNATATVSSSSGKHTIRVEMNVLNDFDEKNASYDIERETIGILLKGDKKVFDIEDG